ncbi:hypothetical protein AA14337_0192 [Acetobacter malorum DSM 14337]|uniref:Uncharacterized protein n=1 Tax=Acetobacter malorum DSM 14337 TaxID=1307910 RepID=A0ABQ0PLM6_9PROT|nr:hypothetical protein [Acetobacter malorum]GBQ75313.1 hypothetical protein AA14337_0192 [Acetobacter malorum DSM 14337]
MPGTNALPLKDAVPSLVPVPPWKRKTTPVALSASVDVVVPQKAFRIHKFVLDGLPNAICAVPLLLLGLTNNVLPDVLYCGTPPGACKNVFGIAAFAVVCAADAAADAEDAVVVAVVAATLAAEASDEAVWTVVDNVLTF